MTNDKRREITTFGQNLLRYRNAAKPTAAELAARKRSRRGRGTAGITQDELAARTHAFGATTTRVTISRLEDGWSTPNRETAVALAKALGVTVEDLWSETVKLQPEQITPKSSAVNTSHVVDSDAVSRFLMGAPDARRLTAEERQLLEECRTRGIFKDEDSIREWIRAYRIIHPTDI